MTTLREYVVTLQHDDGTIRLRTVARDEDEAVRTVLTAECAPRAAVRKVTAGRITCQW